MIEGITSTTAARKTRSGPRRCRHHVRSSSLRSGSVTLGEADTIFHAEGDTDNVGSTVTSGGDVDGDGLVDLLIGAYGREGALLFRKPVWQCSQERVIPAI